MTNSSRRVYSASGGEWDVVVVGGGPAGCAAAVSAARHGAEVLLVESATCLGGMGTAGGVPTWAPFSDGQRILYGGFARELLLASGVESVEESDRCWRPIHAEPLKAAYEQLALDAGVTVLLAQIACDVTVEGGAIKQILLASKGGLREVRAKLFVDATGDGDLAAQAGCPFEVGNETGETQPATLCFSLAGVREEALAGSGYRNIGKELQADPDVPEIQSPHCGVARLGPGLLGFNAGHLWEVDPSEPSSYSQAMIQGRRIAECYRRGLAERYPNAFADAVLAGTGGLLGVRETRRITGDMVLTLDDYIARRDFPDCIARNCYPIDIHHSAAEAAGGKLVNVMGRYEHYKAGESHGIPYRCLIPQGVENLLTAGRCISTDRPVQGSIRVMPPCLVTGQAAGTAAALALAGSGWVRGVDVDVLRGALRKDGAVLDCY